LPPDRGGIISPACGIQSLAPRDFRTSAVTKVWIALLGMAA
jgi:hypothetical protein